MSPQSDGERGPTSQHSEGKRTTKLEHYGFASPQLLGGYTIKQQYRGWYYPGQLSPLPGPERMWELRTMDGAEFTLLYRVSSGLKMQEEKGTLSSIKLMLVRLGSHSEQVRRITAQLRDFRQTIDVIAEWIPLDIAFLMGHYLGIEPIEETQVRHIHTGCYGN
jgi:hypothetical protein